MEIGYCLVLIERAETGRVNWIITIYPDRQSNFKSVGRADDPI